MQEAICAAAFIAGDTSSRAISESRSVAGTETASPGRCGFDDCLGHFLDEERNAVAARQDFVAEPGGKLVPAGDGGHQRTRRHPSSRGSASRTELAAVPRRGSPSGRLVTTSSIGSIGHGTGEVPHQLDGRAIGPLGILEHDKRRPGPGDPQQPFRQGIDSFAPDLTAISACRSPCRVRQSPRNGANCCATGQNGLSLWSGEH